MCEGYHTIFKYSVKYKINVIKTSEYY